MLRNASYISGRHWLLLVVVGGWLAGCEEPVELGIELDEPRLVLSSNFFPDETVRLTLSGSQSSVGEADFMPVTTATVQLFENNSLVADLNYHPEENRYETETFIPTANREYTIHVTAAGFVPVWATSSIPNPVPLDTLEVAGLSISEIDGERVYDYHIYADYDDPVNEHNFYDLRIHQAVIPYIEAVTGDTVRQPAFLKGLRPAGSDAVLGVVSILLEDKPNGEPVSIHLQSRVLIEKELIGDIRAELRTVSDDYYLFRRSLGQSIQTIGSGGGINDQPRIYNNVSEGGLGIFAGYNLSLKSVKLPVRE